MTYVARFSFIHLYQKDVMRARYISHVLQFNFPAGTSRGVMHEKKTYFLLLARSGITGIGECAYIKGLSVDNPDGIELQLHGLCSCINSGGDYASFDLSGYPAIAFGLETALLDLENGGERVVFPSNFVSKADPIQINGLVWMGNESFMRKQVRDKIDSGFSCIKLKIGALDFETELSIIKAIRKEYSQSDLILRLDANGAYDLSTAQEYLHVLADYGIHSVEQPLPVHLKDDMKFLCAHTPIPIALDEQLIGIVSYCDKLQLLDYIEPQYIILKPGLLGGFGCCDEWIELAKCKNIGWWITSALESNIGLNAICQYSYVKDKSILHGLGTGMLYSNNIASPLQVKNGTVVFDGYWDLSLFK